ncbi:hypothetical protein BJ508DRAFT_364936 [Ascobolus immersus RN42]|uniref:Uncharacterized protein n=1 Tax=Ascobolus immersus RN42 TaxID=1160509 RepID=A0A3N4HRX0_ASCIM|nr:hypothetical protein BJ508DRAFT_364936 [Ascobolus immersus RN42]
MSFPPRDDWRGYKKTNNQQQPIAPAPPATEQQQHAPRGQPMHPSQSTTMGPPPRRPTSESSSNQLQPIAPAPANAGQHPHGQPTQPMYPSQPTTMGPPPRRTTFDRTAPSAPPEGGFTREQIDAMPLPTWVDRGDSAPKHGNCDISIFMWRDELEPYIDLLKRELCGFPLLDHGTYLCPVLDEDGKQCGKRTFRLNRNSDPSDRNCIPCFRHLPKHLENLRPKFRAVEKRTAIKIGEDCFFDGWNINHDGVDSSYDKAWNVSSKNISEGPKCPWETITCWHNEGRCAGIVKWCYGAKSTKGECQLDPKSETGHTYRPSTCSHVWPSLIGKKRG